MESAEKNNVEKKRIDGGKNLILLGLGAILIALCTTGVSLAIYHNSGDIYLDRSRPGFLPDEEEVEEEDEKKAEEYNFERDGNLTKESLDKYLKELEKEVEAINSYEKPFDAGVLSDEHLGILPENNSEE